MKKSKGKIIISQYEKYHIPIPELSTQPSVYQPQPQILTDARQKLQPPLSIRQAKFSIFSAYTSKEKRRRFAAVLNLLLDCRLLYAVEIQAAFLRAVAPKSTVCGINHSIKVAIEIFQGTLSD